MTKVEYYIIELQLAQIQPAHNISHMLFGCFIKDIKINIRQEDCCSPYSNEIKP